MVEKYKGVEIQGRSWKSGYSIPGGLDGVVELSSCAVVYQRHCGCSSAAPVNVNLGTLLRCGVMEWTLAHYHYCNCHAESAELTLCQVIDGLHFEQSSTQC